MVSDPLTDGGYGPGRSRRHDSETMIVCPHCATSYRVDTTALGAEGRSVRCVRCKTVWFAQPEQPVSLEKQQAEKLASELVSAADNLGGVATAFPPEADDLAVTGSEPADAIPLSQDHEIIERTPEIAPEPAPFIEADSHLQPVETHDAPSIVPPIEQLAALPTALPDPNQDEDGEKFAVRRERLHARRKRQRSAIPVSMVILALVAVLAGLIGWRNTVVRYAPQTASLYARIGMPVNLRGLVFDSVKTARDTQDGIQVLLVEGTIGSRSNSTVEVPRLRFAVRNAAGMEIYSWTAMPAQTTLAPGEQLAFKSRLASPPTEAQDVTVRFFTRYDAVAGVR
jgi:predicted Zn finger-like uncharacterized protein